MYYVPPFTIRIIPLAGVCAHVRGHPRLGLGVILRTGGARAKNQQRKRQYGEQVVRFQSHGILPSRTSV